MSAAELLDNLNRAGATLEIVDGKPRIRGAKIPDDLMRAVRTNRAEVLAEFEQRKAEASDRYGRVPTADASFLAFDLNLPEASRELIMAYVFRQPRPAHAWVMARANQYFERGVQADDCDWRACLDVIGWQRASGTTEATEFVIGLP